MRICSMEGCGRKSHSRGLCSAHYYISRKSGVTWPSQMDKIMSMIRHEGDLTYIKALGSDRECIIDRKVVGYNMTNKTIYTSE